MPVQSTNPDYDRHLPEWQMMDEALEGERAIKANPRNLPKPSGMVEAEKQDAEGSRHLYEGYVARAQYEHWVRDNLRSMMGLVSRLQPEIKLPRGMEGMLENATADGFGLKQLYFRIVRQIIAYGRAPLVANIDDNGLPFFSTYAASNAINWKVGGVGGRQDLTLAVFREFREKAGADEFSHECEPVFRVFVLRNGVCHTYVENGEGEIVEELRALGATGVGGRLVRGLEYLPIIYCGATDTSPDVDEVPLLSMARAALKHYQLSADYFTSLHYTSHPQPWVAGLDNDKELSVTGPSAAWDLGPNGSCGYLEFQGAGIEAVRKAMDAQKNAALEAGAKVVDVGGQESGEARKARQNDQHATLHSMVITAAEGLEQGLRYLADWLGFDESQVSFTVKPDFAEMGVDPQLAAQLLTAAQAGIVSHDSYWQYISTGKLPERDWQTELELIQQQGPALGSMGGL